MKHYLLILFFLPMILVSCGDDEPSRSGNGGSNITDVSVTSGEYVDLNLPSGTLWATKNIGANNPWDDGYYFSWGECSTKDNYNWNTYRWCTKKNNNIGFFINKYCSNSNDGFVDELTELEASDDAAAAQLGKQWRTPSTSQWRELMSECSWKWTSIKGRNGYYISSKHNNNSMFLPAAGKRYDKEYIWLNSLGCYWSRNVHFYTYNAYELRISIDGEQLKYDMRCYGYSVRPVRAAQKY